MGGVDWLVCGMLVTWQKFAPFFLVIYSNLFSFFFILVGLFSSILGGLLGIGQVQVRAIIAYSSIGHWG